jgi:maltose O-acetyltransferase
MAQFASCGRGVHLSGRPFIGAPQCVRLGDNVHIGSGAFIRAKGGLTIGDNTHISRNLVLYTQNHDHEGERLPYDDHLLLEGVTIGRNVWIGMNVCIAPGTTIGDGAIIGLGTVVAGEVPPMAIVVSAPWRIVGERDQDHYDDLDARAQFGGRGGRPFTS